MTTHTEKPDTASGPTATRSLLGSVRSVGDLLSGPLRVVVVLIVIATIFQLADSNFLSPANITNLLQQLVPIALLSVGLVPLLLLGHMDLSIGAVSGLGGAILATLSVTQGWNVWTSIAVTIIGGLLIGALHGLATTRLQLPSFIVTLAGLLIWQGLQLLLLQDTQTINLSDSTILALTTTFLPAVGSIVLIVIGVAAYAFLQFDRLRRQRRLGVEPDNMSSIMLRVGGVAVLSVVTFVVLNNDLGVPLPLVILLGLILLMNAVLTATRFGRHLLATGGNPESSRRVGIPVRRITIIGFAVCSAFAAFGGIMAASRLGAATQAAGGSDTLLLAIAAPVIAGVSLFGGRGSVWAALIGGLVIGSISNGMDLLGLDQSYKNIFTGIVLFLAVALDAIARLRRRKRGSTS